MKGDMYNIRAFICILHMIPSVGTFINVDTIHNRGGEIIIIHHSSMPTEDARMNLSLSSQNIINGTICNFLSNICNATH